ncbi:MAG: hypothetical protein AB1486_34240 [Planctomycetota bacterium]
MGLRPRIRACEPWSRGLALRRRNPENGAWSSYPRVPVTLTVLANRVIIDARVEAPGFPASPIVYDAHSESLTDPSGYLRIILPLEGDRVLRGKDGSPLTGRPDGLGNPKHPIGFNPGNAGLDFIQENGLLPTLEHFNGFLPDRLAPRLIRLHERAGTLSLAAGDWATANLLFIHDAGFNVKANHGFGEWARSRLIIREGKFREEVHVVHIHNEELLIMGTFDVAPRDGDSWRLVPPEYFEPDPDHPIDPEIGTTDPVWLPPIYDPPLSLRPWGTLLTLELRAADDPAVYADKPEEGWAADLSQLEGYDWIQFRVRLVGNPTTRLAPVLDSLVLPYERRNG